MTIRAQLWTCRKCKHLHENTRLRKCSECGARRPPKRRPAHMAALNAPYEVFVALNGGEHCGICGREPKPGRKLYRDHDHRSGQARGVLCFQCNSVLRTYMTVDWLRQALAYVERSQEVSV